MIFNLQAVEISFLPPSPCKEEVTGWIWPRIFLFFLIWWFFYWAILRITKKAPEYCCRFLTFCHGILITHLTLKDITVNKQEFDFLCNTPLTAYQIYFLSITLSYFLYDFLWIISYGTDPLTIHLHHLCSILLLFKIILSSTGGPGVSYGLLGLEFTNPYLQARWFLRTHGYNNTPIHQAVELWFMFSFIVIRVIGGTMLLFYVEIHPNLDLSLKIAFIGIYIISLILTAQIILFFKKKYLNVSQPYLTTSVLSIFPYRRILRSQIQRTSNEEEQET